MSLDFNHVEGVQKLEKLETFIWIWRTPGKLTNFYGSGDWVHFFHMTQFEQCVNQGLVPL